MVRQGILTLIVAIGFLPAPQRALDNATLKLGDGTVVSLEIADTEPKRNRGLMFRESLAENAGMLFVFEAPGFYPFWMQNCRISLDIAWLDENFRIVSMAESVPPCRLPGCEPPCNSQQCPSYAPKPGTSAKYVVELAAGFAKRHGLKTDQVLSVQLPRR